MRSLNFSPVIAHRGAKLLAPENTLSAFKLAHQNHVNWVEFDVQLSNCGEAFIFHDDHLERTSNGRGLLTEKNYRSLRQLDAGSWFDSSFSNEKIPTLTETLDLITQNQMHANIEIKAPDIPNIKQAEKTALTTCERLIPYLNHYDSQFLVSSFSVEALQVVRNTLPSCPIGLLLDIQTWPQDQELYIETIKEQIANLNCTSININNHSKIREIIPIIRSYTNTILVYTVNDSSKAKELFDLGVTAVFSDDVTLLQ